MMRHLPLLSFYFLLGFCFQFPSVAFRYWLMDTVRVSPAQMDAISGVMSIPWCFKPLYGFISDSYPIHGFRRRPYMILTAFVSAFAWIAVPFCPHDEFIISLTMTLASFGMCFADVMVDSVLVEVARQESEEDKGIIQSWSWMMRFAGGLTASALGAVAYDYCGPTQVFLMNAMIPVLVAYAAWGIPDTPPDKKVHWKDTMKKVCNALCQTSILKPAAFIFVICATPGYGGVMTFFYERELGFTPTEFGSLDVMGHIVSIIGTLIYKRYLRNVPFRKIFAISLIVSFLLENTLFFLVFHTNRLWGIPDFWFAFIERSVLTLVSQFMTMPMVVLGARLCPVGIEGTLYALLMSISNIGGVVGSEWGAMLTSMFGVTGTNFANLWKLMLLCHALDLIPLACLPLLRSTETAI